MLYNSLILAQVELLPQLLRMMDVKTMTGSEGQRKLTLGNATILAYCLRWAGFRVMLPKFGQKLLPVAVTMKQTQKE